MDFTEFFDNQNNRESFKRGDIIYREGDSPEHIYIVTSGIVGLFHITESGKETFLRLFGHGEIMGHRSALAAEPYHANAICLSKVQLIKFSLETFYSKLKENEQIKREILTKLAQDLGSAELRLSNLIDKTAPKRVSEALLYLKLKYPEQIWTRKEIAEFSSTTLETVTRIMGKLEEISAIEKKGRDFIIVNQELLMSHE